MQPIGISSYILSRSPCLGGTVSGVVAVANLTAVAVAGSGDLATLAVALLNLTAVAVAGSGDLATLAVALLNLTAIVLVAIAVATVSGVAAVAAISGGVAVAAISGVPAVSGGSAVGGDRAIGALSEVAVVAVLAVAVSVLLILTVGVERVNTNVLLDVVIRLILVVVRATLAVLATVATSVEGTGIVGWDVATTALESVALVASLLLAAGSKAVERNVLDAAATAPLGTIAGEMDVIAVLNLVLDVLIGNLNFKIILEILVFHVSFKFELNITIVDVNLKVVLIVAGEAAAVTVAVTESIADDTGTVSDATESIGAGTSALRLSRGITGGRPGGAVPGAFRSVVTSQRGGRTAVLASARHVTGVAITEWATPSGDSCGENGESKELHLLFIVFDRNRFIFSFNARF